jgi:hypothetical protein
LGLNLTKKLSIFAEGYGNTSRFKRASLYYDGGLSYLINNHLQIDLSASQQYNATNNYFYLNAGITWQFAKKKMKF